MAHMDSTTPFKRGKGDIPTGKLCIVDSGLTPNLWSHVALPAPILVEGLRFRV